MTSSHKQSLAQISTSEDSLAKTSPSRIRENEQDLQAQEVDCSSSSPNSSAPTDLDGCLSRTFPDYSTQTPEMISERSSQRWMSSGMVFRGEYWTQNTLEHPKDVDVSILSEVLEPSAPLRYFLNREQLQSLINRGEARTIPMDPDLKEIIESQITTLSNMPELEESLAQAHKQKGIETTERLTPAIQEEAPMLYVRRMLPLEYERLQGFPDNWTLPDGQL